MKKIFTVLITLAIAAGCVGAGFMMAAADNRQDGFVLEMQINNPKMSVNGEQVNIDESGTAPIIENERTLVPIRAIIEAMGGTVGWDAETKTVALNYSEDKIGLVIDSKTAYLNGEPSEPDTAPTIINERTMLPIRFIGESFKFDVAWNGDTQTITITKAGSDSTGNNTEPKDSNILVAYFTAAENGEVDAISEATISTYNGKDAGAAEAIAKMIANKTGAELFSIKTTEKYPVIYDDLADKAKEQQDNNERPELATHIENLDKYDTIFVVYPIWWYGMPMPMYSFFDEYDFAGKTIIPAVTHEGSRLSGTSEDIAELEPNATVIKDGFNVRFGKAADAKADVEKWLDELGY